MPGKLTQDHRKAQTEASVTDASTTRFGISFQSNKTIAEYRELADVVARYGFATCSVYQDLFYQPPWPALLQFGERTKTPLVGPAVVNPYLTHPVLVAGHLAVLDGISHGRAFLGVGRGAFFEPIGVPQPHPIRAMREMIDLVQRLLAGDRSHFVGQCFRATEEAYLRGPIPGRRLPVMIGGWGEKTVRLAAEIADMLKVGGLANPAAVPDFKKRLAAAGRDVKLIFGAVTVIDRDGRAAEALARETLATYFPVIARLDPTYPLRDGERLPPEFLSSETLSRYCCFGTPKDVIRHMEKLFEAGVDVFELGTPHGTDEAEAIHLLGREVLPYFT
ncbi:MAG TPA: LLM class flavin-dependent oxidoreductase [Vicinamibacteria bacterium]|nr:LLM class flavin-dependent oxidoreductase [Vicinamibacteria bacterium]